MNEIDEMLPYGFQIDDPLSPMELSYLDIAVMLINYAPCPNCEQVDNIITRPDRALQVWYMCRACVDYKKGAYGWRGWYENFQADAKELLEATL